MFLQPFCAMDQSSGRGTTLDIANMCRSFYGKQEAGGWKLESQHYLLQTLA